MTIQKEWDFYKRGCSRAQVLDRRARDMKTKGSELYAKAVAAGKNTAKGALLKAESALFHADASTMNAEASVIRSQAKLILLQEIVKQYGEDASVRWIKQTVCQVNADVYE